MSILNTNFILAADSYKVNHYSQIPVGVKWVQSSIVPRKPSKLVKELVVSGLQYLVKYLESVRITQADIDEAEIETREQGYEFNKAGWQAIVDNCDGRLPLRITALPEGTVVKPGVAVVLLRNTRADMNWLPSYVETVAQRVIWKFMTVTSISRSCYKTIKDFALRTGSPLEMVAYGLHNFGDRGADSDEAAAWAGIAHGVIFSGTDSLKTNSNIKRLYNTKKAYLSSLEASEHSTMCMNSDAKTRNDYQAAVMMVGRLEAAVERAQRGIGIPVISCVIDTYDSHRFVRDFLGSPELKARIVASGGKMVLRPDSGDPMVEPIDILNIAGDVFGFTINERGYKVLPPYIGVIQGDGINQESMPKILQACLDAGWATGNLVFGMGGGLTHEAGRDEFSFSQKATAMSFAEDPEDVDAWIDIKKEPITDLGKSSLSGYIVNVVESGEIVSRNRKSVPGVRPVDTLVFENGVAYVNDVTFDAVRDRALVGA